MPHAPPPELLTEDQRRHLTASLELVERRLFEIIAVVDGHRAPVPPYFRREARDLPAEFAGTVRPHLADAARTLADLAATLGLHPSPSSQFRTVQALVMSSVVVVEDAAARSLRGYGAVHPGLAPVLDPLLDRLHGQLLAIGRALPTPASNGEATT